jgi:hypothetical protein
MPIGKNIMVNISPKNDISAEYLTIIELDSLYKIKPGNHLLNNIIYENTIQKHPKINKTILW